MHNPTADAVHPTDLEQVTKGQFGFSSLHPEQAMLIRASIAGQNVLGILPTGGGKSACYQIPGVVTRARTLVISPLIALQDDQVRALRKIGIKAFALHSGLDAVRQQAARFYFRNMPGGEPAFLFVSPEMLLGTAFMEQFADAHFDRIAVDEAHCVSTWGNSFRPDYQRIGLAAQRLNIPHCAAFTATIDPRIERDITLRLPLGTNFLRVEADALRPNLRLEYEWVGENETSTQKRAMAKANRLMHLLCSKQFGGPAIIYARTRDSAAGLYFRLRKHYGHDLARRGISTHLFHATLPYDDRQRALEAFLTHERPIVMATSAFGMGINRANVRQVIHYNPPFTLLDYAQQIGRAGRDGKEALCTTFRFREMIPEQQAAVAKFRVPSYEHTERVLARLVGTLDKLPEADRANYNVRTFLIRERARIERSEKITRKASQLQLVMTAVSLLQKAGVIIENSEGVTLHPVEPGGEVHGALLEATQMRERMEAREEQRLAAFFGAENPDQALLWSLLRAD